jgi:hypothetical protein
MSDIKKRFTSRKFILVVATILIVILNEALTLEVSFESLMIIVTTVLGYVGVEGVTDYERAKMQKVYKATVGDLSTETRISPAGQRISTLPSEISPKLGETIEDGIYAHGGKIGEIVTDNLEFEDDAPRMGEVKINGTKDLHDFNKKLRSGLGLKGERPPRPE